MKIVIMRDIYKKNRYGSYT